MENETKELLDFPPYKAVQILTAEAARNISKDTNWYIKKENLFNSCTKIIIILKNNEPYYFINEELRHYKEKKYEYNSLESGSLLMLDDGSFLAKDNPEAIEVLVKLYEHNIVQKPYGGDFGFKLLETVLKDKILEDPELSYYYAIEILKGKFSKGEKIISTHGGWSYMYAKYAIHNRFELGEEVIAADAEWSYLYAKDVIQDRFELAEPSILNSEYKQRYLNFLKTKSIEI